MNATTETQQTTKKANCLSCNTQQPKESLVGNLCTVCHTLQGNNYTGQIVAEAKQPNDIPEVTPETIKKAVESIPAINTHNRQTLADLHYKKAEKEEHVVDDPVISTYKDEGTMIISPDPKVLERTIHSIDVEFKIDNKEETVEESPEKTHTVFGIDLAAEGSESESARLETTSEEETEAEDNAGYKLNTLNTASCTGGSESSPVSTPQVSQNTPQVPEAPEHGVRHEAMKKQYDKQQRMNAAEDAKTNTCADSISDGPEDIYEVLEESEAAALNANGLTDEEDIALDKLLFLFPDSVRYMILEKVDRIGRESPDTSFPDEARLVLERFSNLIDTEIHDCVKHLEEMVVSGEVTDEVLEEMTQTLINDGIASTEPQEIHIQENPNGDMSHVVDAFTYAASNMAEAASIPQNMLQREEPESWTESSLEGADKYAEEIAMQAAKSSIDYEDLVYVCLVTLPDDTVDICASIDLTDLDSAARQLTTLLLEDASSELSPEVTKEFGNTLYISIIGGGVHKTKDLKHICGLYPTHAESLLAEDGIITGEQMIRYTRALMLNGYRIDYPFSKYIPWAESGALLDFMDEVKTEGVSYVRHGDEGYWYKAGTDIAEKR